MSNTLTQLIESCKHKLQLAKDIKTKEFGMSKKRKSNRHKKSRYRNNPKPEKQKALTMPSIITHNLLLQLRDILTRPDFVDFDLEGFETVWTEVESFKRVEYHGYHFKDNGANVLAVAHLDWVHFEKEPMILDGCVLNTPQLDDRLGAWIILHLLPTIAPNLKFDILLCDHEEIGESTAQHFTTDKQYNWIFEFDRAGSDIVLYDYDSKEWENEVMEIAPVGIGAFSDISYLEHLGCKAMNIGCGYHQQHSWNCYADLNETCAMVKKFLPWAIRKQDVFFEHTKTEKTWHRSLWSHSDDNTGWIGFEKDSDECQWCNCDIALGHELCPDCQSWALEELHRHYGYGSTR